MEDTESRGHRDGADYRAWLQDRHDAMVTPRRVVDAAVRRALSSAARSCRRIVVGQDNEVYAVTAEDGAKVIVRISHRDDPRFEAERWALDAARGQGVPTPQVLLIEKAWVDDRSVTVCVEQALPGVPLDALLKDGAAGPHRVLQRLGEVLGRIHRVQVDGFGYLQADGKGWDIPPSRIMLDLLGHEQELMRSAARWEVPSGQVEQGLNLLAANQPLYAWDSASLVHGDFNPAHVLVDGEDVTGVIDFQECSGNHPLFDFVHWDVHWGEQVPRSVLAASYENKAVFGDTYEPLFHLILLRMSLWMLMVRAAQENPHDIEVFRRGIVTGLHFFTP